MTYSLHPGAEQDIADALDFYAEQAGSLVARRFLSEFERVAQLLLEHPGLGTHRPRKVAAYFRCGSLRTRSHIEALRSAFESLSSGTSIGNPATAARGGRRRSMVRACDATLNRVGREASRRRVAEPAQAGSAIHTSARPEASRRRVAEPAQAGSAIHTSYFRYLNLGSSFGVPSSTAPSSLPGCHCTTSSIFYASAKSFSVMPLAAWFMSLTITKA